MYNNNPKVSIIVPTYNVEKYVYHCLDSLINQTLDDIEIIIVDDGSKDQSGKICDDYAKKDKRIRVIHQTNKGLGFSRNSGIEEAKGEYIGFVDSDDIVSLDMFEVLYKNAKKENADISYCNYKKFLRNNEVPKINNGKEYLKIWVGKEEVRQYMLDRIGMPPESKKDNLYGASVCCGIFSRKLFENGKHRFISEREFISEDMIFDIDVIPQCNKIIHTNRQLYYYRYNPSSLTTVYKSDRFQKNIILYKEMYRRLNNVFSMEECFNSMSRYLLTVTRIAIMQEQRFLKQNGREKAIANIKRICRNQELQKVLEKYNYKKLPLKYALFCFLEKKNAAWLLLFMISIFNRKRNNH